MPILFYFFNLEFRGTRRAALESRMYEITTFSNPEAPPVLRDVEFNAILLHIRASSGACECCFAPTV